MSRMAKVAVVMGGYGAAALAAFVSAWLYDVRLSKLPYDTSGGMYAAGETMASGGVFLLVALVPTLLALWFLRRHARFWNALAVVVLAFAAAGLLAVLMPLVIDESAVRGALVFVSLLALAQLLGVPFWLMGFSLLARLAPTRFARRLLVAAVGIEAVIGVCALIHWFVPRVL